MNNELAQAVNAMEQNETLMAMAESCARNLLKMCGNDEATAVQLMTESPVEMVQVLVEDHRKMMKQMTIKAHMNHGRFVRTIYDMMTMKEVP